MIHSECVQRLCCCCSRRASILTLSSKLRSLAPASWSTSSASGRGCGLDFKGGQHFPNQRSARTALELILRQVGLLLLLLLVRRVNRRPEGRRVVGTADWPSPGNLRRLTAQLASYRTREENNGHERWACVSHRLALLLHRGHLLVLRVLDDLLRSPRRLVEEIEAAKRLRARGMDSLRGMRGDLS